MCCALPHLGAPVRVLGCSAGCEPQAFQAETRSGKRRGKKKGGTLAHRSSSCTMGQPIHSF